MEGDHVQNEGLKNDQHRNVLILALFPLLIVFSRCDYAEAQHHIQEDVVALMLAWYNYRRRLQKSLAVNDKTAINSAIYLHSITFCGLYLK